MPIRPDQKKRYPRDWNHISRRIRMERARNRCEQCGVPNAALVARGNGMYMLEDGKTHDEVTGQYVGMTRGSEMEEALGEYRWTRVVLTVGHIDHTPENCDDANLRAWCQRCHLAHDKDHHQANARETRMSRKAAGKLPGFE